MKKLLFGIGAVVVTLGIAGCSTLRSLSELIGTPEATPPEHIIQCGLDILKWLWLLVKPMLLGLL